MPYHGDHLEAENQRRAELAHAEEHQVDPDNHLQNGKLAGVFESHDGQAAQTLPPPPPPAAIRSEFADMGSHDVSRFKGIQLCLPGTVNVVVDIECTRRKHLPYT